MGVDIRAAMAEFLALTIFVFFTNGAAATGAGMAGLGIALQFGLLFTVLLYAVGQYSAGGQMNPAISIALAATKKLSPVQAGVNILAQVAGGIAGAMLVCIVVDKEANLMIGTQSINPLYEAPQAFFAEAMATCLVVCAVLETANHPNAGVIAPLAIGLAVFIGHMMLGPIDGCSLNPARTFGPTLVASVGERYNTVTMESSDLWEDHWVFWLGPIAGAIVAVATNMIMTKVLAPKAAAADAPAETAGGSE